LKQRKDVKKREKGRLYIKFLCGGGKEEDSFPKPKERTREKGWPL